MRVTANPEAATALIVSADAHQKAKYPRVAGLHVSDLIYCRLKARYRNLGTAEPPLGPEILTLFLAGQGHHALLEQGQPELKLVKEYGGVPVHGTVDVPIIRDGVKIPLEIKTTRASSKKPIEGVQHYFEQVATYADMMGVLRAALAVLYLIGDGSKNRGAALHWWDIEFSPSEMAAWRDELAHRVQAIMYGDPTESHRKWECNHCPFNSGRGGPCLPAQQLQTCGQTFFSVEADPSWIGELDRLLA